MKVGDKVLLHTEAFPDTDYAKEDIFIPVIVTEIREDVPNMWSGEKNCRGWKAKGLEDGREYSCNWNSFPSDSMTPRWQWDIDLEYGMLYDIAYVHPPFKPAFVEKYDFLKYCDKHKTLYYDNTGQQELFKKVKMSGCFDCYMEQEYGEKRNGHAKENKNYKGWR